MVNVIKEFSRIDKNEAGSAGGKGASLGEMTRAGIPVPPGFVILASAFERFLEETDLNAEIDTVLHSVDQREMGTVENASARIQALILHAQMPEDIARDIREQYAKLDAPFVAVRSSATAEDSASAAWAGQLDSYLNTTEETLLANVQKCWASLFTPRAIFYRYEKELHKTKISVAVVVQKMVQSEVSGIAFSVHPVTEDYNQLIIEAGFGLGEAIVSGAVTPDSYVIEKTPRRIIDKNITYQSRALWRAENGGNEWRELSHEEGSKPALSDEQALELAEIILRIETHYGFPCDIEWAYEAEHFFITQSRPITTLARKEEVINAYVGKVDENDTETLAKVFSRNMPLYAYYIWHEDILNYQPLWVGEKALTHHLVISDTEEATKASIYYNPGQINKAYRLYRDRLMRAGSFIALFPDFVSSFKEAEEAGAKLKKHTTVENLHGFIDAFMRWYHGEMAAVHATPDMVGIDESIKNEALKLRILTQDLTANFAVIVCDTVEKLFPKYSGYADYLLPEEVSRIETLPFDKMKEKLEERKRGWFLYNVSFHTDRNILDDLLHENHVRIKTEEKETSFEKLAGQVVSKGRAKGRVRVIRSKGNLASFQPGEILVTEMTYPEYVPQMKMAAGVVTDEGGMTCHASIVSRELNIPCVVGTKFATQVLHDGDLVEVDAEKGVVRVLEKSGESSSAFLKAEDFDFTFESRRVDFIFEDLICEYYIPKESTELFRDGVVEVFISKRTVEEMKKEGEKLTPSDLRSIMRTLRTNIQKVLKEAAAWKKKQKFSSEEVGRIFSLFGEICKEYAHFDYSYWDSVYERSKEDAMMRETVQLVQEFKNEFRADLEAVFFKSECPLAVLLHVISRQTGVPEEVLTWYRSSEIAGLLEGTEIGDQELETRKKAYVYYRDQDSNLTFTAGDAAERFIEHFFKEEPVSQTGDVRGRAAHSTGNVVKGRVRVIKRDYANSAALARAIAEMETGEILVSPTTDPESMGAIRKASAIVTDVGGMLSHAAITSRELNIPCIVETRNASRVLKTGDLVEVDAEKGVVRILERAREAPRSS